jgi:hypothetical protein
VPEDKMTENQSGCLVLFHITLGPAMKKSAAIKFWPPRSPWLPDLIDRDR